MKTMGKYYRQHTKRNTVAGIIIILLVVAYLILDLALPIKALSAPTKTSQLDITTPPSNLPWPKQSIGAVGLSDGTIIQSHGSQKPEPIASVAKLITALAVLKKYPLSLGQQGPTITISPADYAIYTKYIAGQGSIVPVFQGEQLSEYQMLEAMLVPSGDNIADALAIWAFGSLNAYFTYANALVKQYGMNNTHIAGDASGYSPDTTSSPDDLIILGSRVMANPILAQIVDMKSVIVPNVGVMDNYDTILGQSGIVGIKTGNSNQAGGVFLGAANTRVNGKIVTILEVLMGAPSLTQVLDETVPLVIAIENDFDQTVLISKGEVLGEYKQPWGGIVQVAANNDLTAYVLQGQKIKANLRLSPLPVPSPSGTVVGTITTPNNPTNNLNSVVNAPIVTLTNATKPSWSWRLLHPNYIF